MPAIITHDEIRERRVTRTSTLLRTKDEGSPPQRRPRLRQKVTKTSSIVDHQDKRVTCPITQSCQAPRPKSHKDALVAQRAVCKLIIQGVFNKKNSFLGVAQCTMEVKVDYLSNSN